MSAGHPAAHARLPAQGMEDAYRPGETLALRVDRRKPSRAVDPRRYTS